MKNKKKFINIEETGFITKDYNEDVWTYCSICDIINKKHLKHIIKIESKCSLTYCELTVCSYCGGSCQKCEKNFCRVHCTIKNDKIICKKCNK